MPTSPEGTRAVVNKLYKLYHEFHERPLDGYPIYYSKKNQKREQNNFHKQAYSFLDRSAKS